ncbi:MAG TPA: Flp family type IVb pilin [Acidobacteriaceae bacterium]|jgi:Flp pilus assembly pilin Flp
MGRETSKPAVRDRGLRLAHLWYDESGADMIEYVLIATWIALVAIAAVQGVGDKVGSYYNTIASSL